MCREHTPFYHAGAYDDKRTNLIIGDAKAGLENLPDAPDLYVGLVADGSLEKRLAERKLDTLSYYDAITHTRMFSLNRTVREQCRDETRVMTVENPLFMCGADTHVTVFEEQQQE